MRSRQTVSGRGSARTASTDLAERFAPGVLPAYVEEAIANYLTLGAYLRLTRPSLRMSITPRFLGETREALIAAYLHSAETEPLLLALEGDIRRLLAKPMLKALAEAVRKRPARSLLGTFAARLGFGSSAVDLPPCPSPRELLTTRSTDDKAALLTSSFVRFLTEARVSGVDQLARVATFVRIARFSTTNGTRDRRLVEATFAADRRAAVILGDAVLAGHDLLELGPFISLQAAREASRAGHDARVISLCRCLFGADHPPAVASAIAELGTVAALRAGEDQAAIVFAQQWHRLNPAAPRPRLAEAAALGGSDPTRALTVAKDAGPDPRAAVLRSRLLRQIGALDLAEQELRRALGAAVSDRADLLSELHNLQLSRGEPAGVLQGIFAGHGNWLRWHRFHPSDLLDAGTGGATGSAGPRISIIMAVLRGGDILRATLDSILAQDYEAIEVILVQVGSKSSAALEALPDDARVIVLHERTSSCAAAWNAGLTASSGQLFAIAHEGDFWLRGLLAAHVAARRGKPKMRATVGLSLPVREDGIVPCDAEGQHARPCERTVVTSVATTRRTGGYELDSADALAEFLGKIALHSGEQAIGMVDRILTVRPAAASDGTDPSARAATSLQAGIRSLWHDRHLASVRGGQLAVGPAITRELDFKPSRSAVMPARTDADLVTS